MRPQSVALVVLGLAFVLSGVLVAHGFGPAGQGTTIGDRKTAADGVTKGWLIFYPWPYNDPSQQWRTIAGTLVIARHGRVIRKIANVTSFWGWGFWAGGRQVVYEAGPLHGATECFLVDVKSGRQIATFGVHGDCGDKPDNAPAWVKSIE